ncbi:MAG TPA: alpha/beta hydrolase [Caulobacteraceae bacterium]|nr:alpha/beta hydrolase [Caulobacteraceae bacterium]
MGAGRITKARLFVTAALLAPIAGAIVLWVALTGRDSRDAFADSRPPPDLAERFYPPEGWAWGLIQAGDGPVQRYGVGGPPSAPRADVLILPDYGESAETWFETARDLIATGDAVWVLEGVGQGGSARLTGRRDLGELKSFDPDVASVQAVIQTVIRPAPGRPLVILGQGVGALAAARAVETGATPAGLVLSAPRCDRALAGGALVFLRLGAYRAGGAWVRSGPDDFAVRRTHDRWRGAITHVWQIANPDLRLGGESLDWQAALLDLQQKTEPAAARIQTPTLLLDADHGPPCLVPAHTERHALPGADPAFELESDRWRMPWLSAVERFISSVIPEGAQRSPGTSDM